MVYFTLYDTVDLHDYRAGRTVWITGTRPLITSFRLESRHCLSPCFVPFLSRNSNGKHRHRRRGPQATLPRVFLPHSANRSRPDRVHSPPPPFLPASTTRPHSASTPSLTTSSHSTTRAGSSAFFAWPPFAPLLFENESSDARDHCANERSERPPFPPG